ncbi:MAG: divergent polysaccharide deacetylase family protein [Fusobacteria bacterium]|nr:divergent polysaccharide deacetylase family protein [Fusobacteriota bacterium]
MKKVIIIILVLISSLAMYYFFEDYKIEKKDKYSNMINENAENKLDKNKTEKKEIESALKEKERIEEELGKIEKEITKYSYKVKNEIEYKVYILQLNNGETININSNLLEVKKNSNKYDIVYKKKKYMEINIVYLNNIANKLAILIDDVGMNTELAYEFNKINASISFAAIPFLPRTKEASDILREHGYEVILHMPMESFGSENLNKNTKGLIRTDMDNAEIRTKFEEALKNVGKVNGFNNHMGSKFTADHEKMNFLLELAKEKNLYYIDSWTSNKSVGYKLAKEKGIKTYKSSVFLDNEKDVEYIKERIRVAVEKTIKEKKVIAIGHYHKATAQAIIEMLDYIKEKNVELVFINELLE